jgi:voltage-gated potassium channel
MDVRHGTKGRPARRGPSWPLARIAWGLCGLGVVVLFGVMGYLAAGWSLGDAIYMVAITISTVGFAEVRPLATPWLRLHTIVLITFGYVALGFTLASLVALLAEEELRRLLGRHRMKRQIDGLRDHVIVVGLGRMGLRVCSELDAADVPFVAVDNSSEIATEVERRQWLAVLGDATEERVLEEAGVRRARALVAAIPDDALNVFITLTAREMTPDLRIFARAEMPSTEQKLRRAGAQHVVLPAAIGAQRIVTMLTNPAVVSFTELVAGKATLEIELDEVRVTADGAFLGKTLRDLDIGRKTGVVVVAVKRADGSLDFPPDGGRAFVAGDGIVLLGRRGTLDELRAVYQP